VTTHEKLTRLLGVLKTAVDDLRRYAEEVALDRLVRDGDASRMVREAVQEAIQASIDCGQVLLARQGVAPPDRYREVFERLRDRCGLDPALAESMAEASGLRNVLVHV
jgi:uncharacterized protein YutE (UPF0331/DUF86 family)